jgi:hypothetical protein
MPSPLADLDELILKCRDDKAKSYIHEAVACYKAGAFRASIVSTWIAVSFDIIDKMKELSLAGDKEAEQQLEKLEEIHRSANVAEALRFEKGLLTLAKDKFELISQVEFIDLERLQEDRNRCAHPSMNVDGEIFQPSAELARVHIRSAVTHLLQYPPAQGKYALDRLTKEVSSEYFPTEESKTLAVLEKGPLRRSRESLVRNFIIVLIKKILCEPTGYRDLLKISSALTATRKLHSAIYDKTLSNKLSDIIRNLEAGSLNRIIILLQHVEGVWEYLDSDVKQRIEMFVEKLPDDLDSLKLLPFLISFPPLSKHVEPIIRSISSDDFLVSGLLYLPAGTPSFVIDRVIDCYLKSGSYSDANLMGKRLSSFATGMTPEQIIRILKGASSNGQVKRSVELENVITELRKSQIIDTTEFDNLLRENGLTDYLSTHSGTDQIHQSE